MFFIRVVFVYLFICSYSAIAGEILIPKYIKKHINEIGTIALGFVLATLTNTIIFNILSIQMAVLITQVLFCLFAYANIEGQIGIEPIIQKVKGYTKTFVGLFILMNIFFAPLHISGNYGPFTDGGGDVSIYADLAKLFTQNHKPAYGLESMLKKAFELHDYDFYRDNDPLSINPPRAEASSNLITSVEIYSATYFSPISEWFFLTKDIYSIFFTLLSFFFSVTVLLFYELNSKYSKALGYLGSTLFICSLGFISVFYNVYFLQAISLFLNMVTLFLLDRLPLRRLSSHIFILGTLLLFASGYLYAFAVVGPFYLLSLMIEFRGFSFFAIIATDLSSAFSKKSILSKWLFVISIVTSGLWVLATIFASTIKFLLLMLGNFANTFGRDTTNTYMGDRLSMFGLKWSAFISGISSQQYFQPFVTEYAHVQRSINLGNIAFSLILLMSAASYLTIAFSRRGLPQPEKTKALLFPALAVLIVIFYILVGNNSLYTQAKAAQYVLIILYAYIVFTPTAFIWRYRSNFSSISKKLAAGNFVLISLFIGCSLVPRLHFLIALSHNQERGRILESSFFREADRVLEETTTINPLILIEPVKSADTYINIHPFFGKRMMTTKNLSYKQYIFDSDLPTEQKFHIKSVHALDIVQSERTLNNIWVIRPISKKMSSFKSEEYFTYDWESISLNKIKLPFFIATADYYERIQDMKLLSDGKTKGQFTFIRNGGCGIFLPPHLFDSFIDVEIKPSSPSDMDEIEMSLKRQSAFPDITFRRSGAYLIGRWIVPSSSVTQFIYLLTVMKSYEVSLKVNDEDVLP